MGGATGFCDVEAGIDRKRHEGTLMGDGNELCLDGADITEVYAFVKTHGLTCLEIYAFHGCKFFL